ncbi:MAG: hypothetical protein WAU36_06760 [Cyclobacteriaceae bacterium]
MTHTSQTVDKRIHKLLKLLLKEHLDENPKKDHTLKMFSVTIDEAKTELKLNQFEIQYLCRTLGRDNIIEFNHESIWFSEESGFHNALEAYYKKQYLPKTNFWKIPINISLVVGGFATFGLLLLTYHTNNQVKTIEELKISNKTLTEQIDSIERVNQVDTLTIN